MYPSGVMYLSGATWSKTVLARSRSNVSEWSNMSTCDWLNQDNVSEWSYMSTCDWLNQDNVSEWS